MIFGHKEYFAIECIIENRSDSKHTFGQIAFWINNEQLGQLSLTVVLEVPVSAFKESLDNCGTKKQKSFKK